MKRVRLPGGDTFSQQGHVGLLSRLHFVLPWCYFGKDARIAVLLTHEQSDAEMQLSWYFERLRAVRVWLDRNPIVEAMDQQEMLAAVFCQIGNQACSIPFRVYSVRILPGA